MIKVPVCGGDEISTILVGDKTKQVLVLVHGFGGSAALFYRVVKDLAEHYYVVMFDIIGMGASSRPEFTCNTYEETNDFMLVRFESWRKEMDITQFILAGHSYGGYLSGLYAAWRPQHIKKLVLLSPLGVKQRPENFDVSQVRFNHGNPPPRWALYLSKKLWGKLTPFSVLRKLSEKRVRSLLQGYIRAQQPIEDPAEFATMEEYLFQILLRPASTEFALFKQVDPGLHAHVPLDHEDRLRNSDLPFPITFMYGDKDWMDPRGSSEIVKANRFFASGESQLLILENAGH